MAKILVVDEEAICTLISKISLADGHNIMEAENGRHAPTKIQM